ncbi:Outer membrane protein YfgL [Limimaricola hongkongensis DSM 17492]|uniref:Outer membrane protein YfgL n=1 Tax=Limimaricola hongkongensis DSM 17492 TaxID=1122180 RepID=A0A017HBE7_9RHOB|nr:Outer membrane protein YfgL [Limimaricola hongkongensis DSM 17492]
MALPGAAEAAGGSAAPLALMAPVANADWPQRGGGADRDIAHPALGSRLAPLFRTDFGAAETRRTRITAEPVVAGGRVFVMDAEAGVAALSTGGAPLWQRSLVPAADAPGQASGGGLATDGARLYAVTGFGELVALDAATGARLWSQDMGAPGAGAPAIAGGIVYAVSRDGRGIALDAATGRLLWQVSGIEDVARFDGGAGPAVKGDLAVFPFASGEIVGVFPEGGRQRWSAVVAGRRTGVAAATAASGISGDPVLKDGRVYAGNATGRLSALDDFTGETIWSASDGATGPVVPADNALFLLNDLGQLVRIDAATGAAVWRADLPKGTPGGFLRRDRRVAHYGPVLAGGRLVVAGSDGAIRQFDPVSGRPLGEIALEAGAASAPVVAGGVLYVVTSDGALAAFR